MPFFAAFISKNTQPSFAAVISLWPRKKITWKADYILASCASTTSAWVRCTTRKTINPLILDCLKTTIELEVVGR